MSFLGQLAQLGLFLFLIIPSILVVLGVGLLESGDGERSARRNLWIWLVAAVLVLVSLDLVLATNPYNKGISSSLPALGMLPILVALLALLVRRLKEIVLLWKSDKVALVFLGLVGLAAAGWLWLREATTLYTLLALSAALALAWQAATRASGSVLVGLSLACLGSLVITGGGAFISPGLDNPSWVLTALQIITGLAMVLAIFLSSALLFTGLKGGAEIEWPAAGWRILLAILLIGGSAYWVYWDGVWSAAHARVFEDHLPLAQFLLALMAGASLALSFSGWRRLSGLVFVFVVCAVAIQALLWGWNISAVSLTEQRAQRVDAAIGRFHQEKGRYPAGLAELTPNYLLYLPPPVVVRLGGWCYQGGQDYYRLGYVGGQFTYQRATFEAHLFAKAGELPDGGWNCDRMVDRVKQGGLTY